MAGNAASATRMRRHAALAHSAFGVVVVESAGWTTRGRSADIDPRYNVTHHTASERDVTALLKAGRPDVAGPLCNREITRDGFVRLIASGRANHVGVATITNSESWGDECTGPIPTGNTGADAFPNYLTIVQHTAAVRIVEGWGRDRIVGHKEVARPVGRKIDPVFSMPDFEDAIDHLIGLYKRGDDTVALSEADLDAITDRIKKTFSIKDKMNVAFGTTNNDNAFAQLIKASQASFNDVAGLKTAIIQLGTLLGDDEAKLLGAISALDTTQLQLSDEDIAQLAASVQINPAGLAQAVSLDLAARLAN